MVMLSITFVLYAQDGPSNSSSETPGQNLEQRIQLGHSANVTSVSISTDERYALTGSDDETAKLWDLQTGRLIRTFSGHVQDVNVVAFAPGGEFAITGSSDRTAKLWHVASGREVREFDSNSPFISAGFTSDGRYLVTGHYHDRATLWDVATGEVIRHFSHPGLVLSVAISPDDQLLLTGSTDDIGRLWQLDSGRQIRIFDGHDSRRGNGLTGVAFSPDLRHVLTAASDGKAVLWELSTGQELRSFVGYDGGIAFTPDGDQILAGRGSKAELWHVDTGETIRVFDSGLGRVRSVAVSSSGRYAVTGTHRAWGEPDDAYSARVWEIGTGRLLNVFYTGSELSNSRGNIAISPLGNYALTMANDNTARLWDLSRGLQLRTLVQHSARISDIAFSPDGQTVVTGSDTNAALWDVTTGRQQRNLPDEGAGSVSAVGFSPDGRYIATGYGVTHGETVVLWDAESGTRVRVLNKERRLTGAVHSVEFSPAGSEIISTYGDYITLWDIEKGQQIRSWDVGGTIQEAVFTPDGRYIITARAEVQNKDELIVWDTASGRRIRSFGLNLLGDPRQLAVSPDGRTILVGYYEDAWLFDVTTGNLIRRLAGHGVSVHGVAFSPTGRYALTAGEDSTIRYWSVADGESIYVALATPEGQSLAWTDDGYFTGDQELARSMVVIVDGLRTIGIDQFFDQYYRPDIIEAKIAGRDISDLVGNRTAADAIVPLPEVSVEVERGSGTFRGLARKAGIAPAIVSASNYRVMDGRVRVRVTAEDRGGGAEEIRLYHNGTRVAAGTRGLARQGGTGAGSGGSGGSESDVLSQTFTIQLVDGENRLRALAFTETRVESDPAAVVLTYEAPRQVRPTLWVLAVGINEYRNSRYNLNYAVVDARGFTEAVLDAAGTLFTDVVTELILDGDATKEAIIASLESISERAKPEDVFMFFYAGHGFVQQQIDGEGEFYFVTPGVTQMTRPDQLARLGLSSPELSELIAEMPARKRFMVLDACHAGAAVGDFAFRGAAEERALARLQRAQGSAVLAATREDQFAQEFSALGQGALTKAVIEGLRGAAGPESGQLTVLDILRYADEAVPQLTAEHAGQEQFAQLYAPREDFPIGVR
jgi:WD40 repeat protein